MATRPLTPPEVELDLERYELRRGGRAERLEKLPMELLILLSQRHGQLVTRAEILDRLWGQDVFIDADAAINTAVRKVRRALEDDPENPRFVETVVGKGYRFVGPISVTAETASPAAEPVSGPGHVRRAAVPRHWLRWAGAVGVAAAAVAYVVFVRATTTRAPIRSLAVLPLQNLSGDPGQDYFADGMTEELIGRLSAIRRLRVISRTSTMQFKGTRQSVPEIARTLGADAVVEGSVMRSSGRVRVSAQLIRADTDEHIWSASYDRELEDVLTLQSEVAGAIARRIDRTLGGREPGGAAAARTVSPDVYESYLKGRFALNASRNGPDESVGHFKAAISGDPSFAAAWSGLAAAYHTLGTVLAGTPPGEAWPRAVEAARKALELDPEDAEAHAVLASALVGEWRWKEAEAEYRRALELNPSHAAAHVGLGNWLLRQGRTEEALTWAQRGRELDPLALFGVDIGWMLFHARRYDDAIRELRTVLAVRPDEAAALWFLGFALTANGQPEDAIPVLTKAAQVADNAAGPLGVLVRAYAHAGRRAEALSVLEELKRRRRDGYVPAAAFVNAYLGLGDHDQAFLWLERAYQEHSGILRNLKVHPFFDPLRDDPRFADLVGRMNFVGAEPGPGDESSGPLRVAGPPAPSGGSSPLR
jgi:TolB-like protein/DNA-binding winged helix-turn-helix (wHTH) protein/Tfp pilus assembly protein PilF